MAKKKGKVKRAEKTRSLNGAIDVMVETPKGSRNKFKFDEQFSRFRLDKVLPAGADFPYDFGFIPGTRADDGDPIDVLLLMDQPAFAGCIVPSRIVGVIEAEQVEADGKKTANNRLLAVAQEAHDYRNLQSIDDLDQNLIDELGHFFVSYHAQRNSKFRIRGTHGPKHALRLVKKAIDRYQQ